MLFQRITSKSPCRTQSHSAASFTPDEYRPTSCSFKVQQQQYSTLKPTHSPAISVYQDELAQFKQKCHEQQKIIESQQFQINEMKQFISDCQISLSHCKQQLEEHQSLNEKHNSEVTELQQLIKTLKNENEQLAILYNEKQREFEEWNCNNKSIIDNFNKQFEGALRARIESDIKEIHNKYLREIQMLKAQMHNSLDKQGQQQEVIRQLQERCEELIEGIEAKNNYIDELLLSYGELDEKYEKLKKKVQLKINLKDKNNFQG